MSPEVSDKTVDDFIDHATHDYHQKFSVTMVIDGKHLPSIRNALGTLGADKLRAAWNYYLDDPVNYDSADMGRFLWSSVLNRYARVVGAKMKSKSGDEWLIYVCEDCGGDQVMSREDVEVLWQPCFYCKGRKIQEDVYKARKLEEWQGSGRCEAFMRKKGLEVKEHLVQGIGDAVRDKPDEDELECNYL